MNQYLQQVNFILPRLMSFFDRDIWNDTCGIADRQYASWCTIDFANGTQQGAVHGLSRLLAAGLLPDWCPKADIINVIDISFQGVDRIIRPNGSLEEALPFENSFCVTALAAHDLLWAHRLSPSADAAINSRRLFTVAKLIGFLRKADETHGMISNHLATAAGALLLWHDATGENWAKERGHFFLRRILDSASSEGWFSEYGGADPGYQTLCLHYLALLSPFCPDMGLERFLARAARFLSYFAFPNGSFGGVVGSRRTRFYYPSGLEIIGVGCREAAGLATFMRGAIEQNSCVTLAAMDDPNVIPMFNSYVVAACIAEKPRDVAMPPCMSPNFSAMDFPEAGIVIRANEKQYTVISTRYGGAFESVSRDGTRHFTDGGSVIVVGNRRFSTQCLDPKSVVDKQTSSVTVTCRPSRMLRSRSTPLIFILLRCLSLTVMRIPLFSRLIKRFLAYMLMGRRTFLPMFIRRTVVLDREVACTQAELLSELPRNAVFHPRGGNFSSIHMASVGYWQGDRQ